ncbi:hypothetical protein HZU75_10055 [Chitinibacter fontanus]|uniref:Uncharacterized protein n=1 Tax=Chitinibacter fontanus TaxID=1737446 RepID=A0A7D5VAJ6_9NEIS|nr:hypothetical protein [Chitinibacter fontanus]QLI81852.1 hypothetical protein HZU75_10055 [Chitinibacter fontanus]
MLFGIIILLAFVLIPIAVIVIPVLLTKSEIKQAELSGPLRTGTKLIRLVATVVCVFMSYGAYKTGHSIFAFYCLLATLLIYCALTAQGFEDRFYAEAARQHCKILAITAGIILISASVLILHNFLSTEPNFKLLKATSGILVVYGVIYAQRIEFMRWLKWVFRLRSSD